MNYIATGNTFHYSRRLSESDFYYYYLHSYLLQYHCQHSAEQLPKPKLKACFIHRNSSFLRRVSLENLKTEIVGTYHSFFWPDKLLTCALPA